MTSKFVDHVMFKMKCVCLLYFILVSFVFMEIEEYRRLVSPNLE